MLRLVKLRLARDSVMNTPKNYLYPKNGPRICFKSYELQPFYSTCTSSRTSFLKNLSIMDRNFHRGFASGHGGQVQSAINDATNTDFEYAK